MQAVHAWRGHADILGKVYTLENRAQRGTMRPLHVPSCLASLDMSHVSYTWETMTQSHALTCADDDGGGRGLSAHEIANLDGTNVC
jgi:hypothetical protein